MESPDCKQVESTEEVVEALKQHSLSDKESSNSHETRVSVGAK